MSVLEDGPASAVSDAGSLEDVFTPRVGALVGVAVLALGYCSTLYAVMGRTGRTDWLIAAVAVGLVAGVAVARQPERRVLPASVALGLAGLAWYSENTIAGLSLATVRSGLLDTLALLTGASVTTMAATELWVAVVVPVPVFGSVYLASRRRYVLATLAGGWLALLLALTGDAVTFDTLVATVGAAMVAGFGELDRRGGSVAAADGLVVLLAAMAVLALFVPMVPSGSAAPFASPDGVAVGGTGGPGDSPAAPSSLQDQLLQGGSAEPAGPIELSPEVQFVVRAEEPRRWRVAVHDRYDGQGWYSLGRDSPYGGGLFGRPGEGRTVDQQFELAQPTSGGLPHAARPVEVSGLSRGSLAVSDGGAIRTYESLPANASYGVVSEVPTATPEELRAAGRDYPASVVDTNLYLPPGTPDRVGNLTDRITANADTPYDEAVAIEAYLERSKGYSLNVSDPGSRPVDAFLFEMEEGYCTYFASSMAAMLRTQGVPARVAVGYKSGQYVDGDTRVVRGTDAHSWVEVYFPEVGWVEFDPTPSGEWASVHGGAVEDARDSGATGVDVPESANESVQFDPPEGPGAGTNSSTGDDGNSSDGTSNGTVPEGVAPEDFRGVGGQNGSDQPFVDPGDLLANGTVENASADDGTSTIGSRPRRLLDGFEGPILGTLLLAGAVAGARRAGVTAALRRTGGTVWQRRLDPTTDVERARDRLERWLARHYRPRRPDETPREYLDSLPADVDDRVRRTYDLLEAARYAGGADRELADEVVGLVDDLTRSSLPVVGRFYR